MRHFLTLLFIVFLSISYCFSQDSNHSVSIEVGYPLPIGNNVFNKGYGQDQIFFGHDGSNGLWDFGIGYNLTSLGKFGIGAAMNIAKFKLYPFQISTINYRPRINFNYPIQLNKLEISPSLGVGYSIHQYKGLVFTDVNGNTVGENPTSDGLLLNSSIRISTKRESRLNYYVQIGYEYTSLFPKDEALAEVTKSTKIHILFSNLGLSYHF